jgi:nucleoside-diphosphate kinase
MKMVRLTSQEATDFCKEHQGKSFFPSMIKFMCSSSVVIICLQGENAIQFNREILGATNPAEAQEKTIRKIFGVSIEANAVHGSDSVPAAQREIAFFFSARELLR